MGRLGTHSPWSQYLPSTVIGNIKSISFFLKRQLHVASSLRDDSLRFFEMSLQVSASLFPPQASFAQYLLKEYWGQPKQRTE